MKVKEKKTRYTLPCREAVFINLLLLLVFAFIQRESSSLVLKDIVSVFTERVAGSCDLVPDQGYVHFTMSFPTSEANARNAMSLCAVDSALQHKQPGEKVVLWTSDAEAYSYMQSMSTLMNDPDLLVCNPNLEELFEDTPFEGWKCWGKYCPNNYSNALRLVLLYKFGGVYLDTDVIILRSSASRMGNLAISKDSSTNRVWNNGAYMNFPSQHKLLWLLMSSFISEFDGDKYGQNGPKLMDRVVKPCMDKAAFECKHVSLAAEEQYAPVHWEYASQWLNSTSFSFLEYMRLTGTWGYHWYGSSWFKSERPCLGCGTVGHSMFQNHCPRVYGELKHEFMCSTCSGKKAGNRLKKRKKVDRKTKKKRKEDRDEREN